MVVLSKHICLCMAALTAVLSMTCSTFSYAASTSNEQADFNENNDEIDDGEYTAYLQHDEDFQLSSPLGPANAVGLALELPPIILKLDDLRADNYHTFDRVTDFCLENDVHASYGAIVGHLTENGKIPSNLCTWLRQQDDESFEIWNHGMEHVRGEFSDRSFEEQSQDVSEGVHLLEECDIKVAAFGAPYNESMFEYL